MAWVICDGQVLMLAEPRVIFVATAKSQPFLQAEVGIESGRCFDSSEPPWPYINTLTTGSPRKSG
jgi:hypothetical protein